MVRKKIGIDLEPINCSNEDEALWLQVLVWPKNLKRFQQLTKALEICRLHPSSFELIKGDAFEEIEKFLEKYNEQNTALCIHHSFAVNQISKDDQVKYYDKLKHYSNQSGKVIHELTIKWNPNEEPRYILNEIRKGAISTTELAKVHHHGKWIQWIAP